MTSHNGIPDLWNGFTTSPVALTLKHKGGYLDLTGLTRMRWRTRTENLHVLHPVVKLADGTLLVGSQTFQSPQRRMVEANGYTGDFVVSEVTFDDQRWFELDPQKVVVKLEVNNPDLSRVDEIGYVDLMPGGGHGTAGMHQRLVDRGVRGSAQALRQPALNRRTVRRPASRADVPRARTTATATSAPRGPAADDRRFPSRAVGHSKRT